MYRFGISPVDITMDIEEIQRPLPPPPTLWNLSLSTHNCDNLPVFDLVTSELDNRCEILQVATCLFSNTDVSFSVYVLSTRQISLDATAVTHFSLGRASDHNVLLRNGIKVVAVCWSVAEDFFQIGLGKSPNHIPPLLQTTNSLLMHVLLQHTSILGQSFRVWTATDTTIMK